MVSNVQQSWLWNENVRIKRGSATNDWFVVRFFSNVPSKKQEGDRNNTFFMLYATFVDGLISKMVN